MLWYKTWLETRWRFLIGLVVLICSSLAVVFSYPEVLKLMRQMPPLELGSVLGRRVQEAAELVREYRGYIWSHGFAQNLSQMGTLFAALLGTGGVLSQPSGGAALYTMSLPVSRSRLLGVRALTGLLQWLALALVSSLLIPLFSPAIGESYSLASALVHGLCLFLAGSVFFTLALLLSTVFADVWRPLLLTLAVAVLLGIAEFMFRDLTHLSLASVMNGEAWFRTDRLPLLGLVACAGLSAAFLWGSAVNLARHDF